MSLLIPNTEINNLYYNGRKIKAAYFNGEKVWTERHRVDWRLDDEEHTLIKSEYVTDGQPATPPVSQEWTDDFHSYIISDWDTPCDAISADTTIHALSRVTTTYLLRGDYGVNSGFLAELDAGAEGESFNFGGQIAFLDGTSNMAYTSVSTGQVSTSGIFCSHTGTTSSLNATFRAARYRAALLDADAIRAAGFTRLRFTGSYTFGKGTVYKTANLRAAFVSLQNTATVTTTTSAGVTSDNLWQIRHNVDAGTGTESVAAVSGTINGSLDIPESGSFYVVAGELTKAFKGAGETRIDNMWVE